MEGHTVHILEINRSLDTPENLDIHLSRRNIPLTSPELSEKCFSRRQFFSNPSLLTAIRALAAPVLKFDVPCSEVSDSKIMNALLKSVADRSMSRLCRQLSDNLKILYNVELFASFGQEIWQKHPRFPLKLPFLADREVVAKS